MGDSVREGRWPGCARARIGPGCEALHASLLGVTGFLGRSVSLRTVSHFSSILDNNIRSKYKPQSDLRWQERMSPEG